MDSMFKSSFVCWITCFPHRLMILPGWVYLLESACCMCFSVIPGHPTSTHDAPRLGASVRVCMMLVFLCSVIVVGTCMVYPCTDSHSSLHRICRRCSHSLWLMVIWRRNSPLCLSHGAPTHSVTALMDSLFKALLCVGSRASHIDS